MVVKSITLKKVIKMHLLSIQSSAKKTAAFIILCAVSNLIFPLLVMFFFCLASLEVRANDLPAAPPHEDQAAANSPEPDTALTDIVNPFKSTCYDWEGKIIPCIFQRPYAELLFNKPIPDPRFIDNQNGTVNDNLTGLIWLKNTQCFGMMDWESARLAVKRLKEGDCGSDYALVLSDGSSAGDWRLPTMKELSALIDYSRRNPALPSGQVFSDFPSGYYWSATLIDYHPQLAWIVYIETGTTCYEDIRSNAGHIWPVRRPKE